MKTQQQKANYTRITDYGFTEYGVTVDWETPGQARTNTFTFQDLAGALWDLGHCDRYTLKNGELLCEMDGRPGFHSTALPSEVWAALGAIDRQSVCLQMIFELQKSESK